ncbi:MAG: alpha-galactosidase [Oscillospiraceae bacterium]|nr:alpha-galactosidase [Oscillospiraceae bacterium]
MSIHFDASARVLTLRTASSSYQMQIDELGFLRHLYYGRDTGTADLRHLHRFYDLGFSGNHYEHRLERAPSPDTIPQEYASSGAGDYRVPAVVALTPSGHRGTDWRYVSHEITAGKYALAGLPSAYDNGGECETLTVTLRDAASGLTLRLHYGVFEALDIITRAAELQNDASVPVTLEKAASVCLDLPFGSWDLMHFHGRHCLERQPERLKLPHGVVSVGSERGMSSHQHNPFVILCDHAATEDAGDCIGLMLVYSGSFRCEIERSQTDSVRAVLGVSPLDFSWTLQPGETFTAPEVLLSCAEGLTRLSQQYHRFLRRNICRGRHHLARRPVLVNSWEAAYFDISADRLLALAREAKDVGAELFVLDDGWFRGRKDDNAGLGDWFENKEKLPHGLGDLVSRITALGLQFGIWIEPEMVNENSDLYRAHPDWALTVPGRTPIMARNQLVLDMSRADVRDYLFDTLSALLREHDISYVKWDMNRSLSDVFSKALPAARQGEVLHRYVLGVYDLLERLTSAFPDVLFEGCAGGGGRFDAGMLCYVPQIWLSDDTDPIERLKIQRGTSFGYPMSAMGAHVSASPNHQTGRTTPMETRAVVAMAGAFGYELDLTKLSPEEKDAIRAQIRRFRADEDVVQNGLYYRLTDETNTWFTAWQTVSEDQSRSIVSLVVQNVEPYKSAPHLRLKGLDPDAVYEIEEDNIAVSGAALMYAGYTMARMLGDYPAAQLHLKKKEGESQ